MTSVLEQEIERKAKSREAARDKATADGWKGFVNLELTDDQKPLVKALSADSDAVWGELLEMVDSEYKLTVSYEGQRSVYNVSLTCRNAKDPNAGLTLTGRGGSFIGAAASLVFKHVTILKRRWDKAPQAVGRLFEPDDVG